MDEVLSQQMTQEILAEIDMQIIEDICIVTNTRVWVQYEPVKSWPINWKSEGF